MALYSYKNSQPRPIPFSITLSSGFTRTDPTTFTEEELIDAGYVGPYEEPPYNPQTQQVLWDGQEFYVVDLPPPPPISDWDRFKSEMLNNDDINSILLQAFSVAPIAAISLPTTLINLSNGGSNLDFSNAWNKLKTSIQIPQEVLDYVLQLSVDCNLPIEFQNLLSE